MKKVFLFIALILMFFTIISCDSTLTVTTLLGTGVVTTEEISLFQITETMNENEFGITRILLNESAVVNDYYVIQFDNGDLVEIEENNSFKYIMQFDSDYSSTEMVAFGQYGELDLAKISIVLVVGLTPTTGRVNNFDLTLERNSVDVTFDSYINTADISQTIATQLFNSNAIELIIRVRYLFETVFGVEFK
ncbi:MAG: hypothetical protein PHC62_06090 [Candidatus Izemoplasmatales bacterium]|jgi:hypothetical protein|nr:hypothetical protein [Candidatus Izemoplasmatales bacterium]